MKRLHSEAVDVSPADVASMAQRRAAILSRMGDINGPVITAGGAPSVVKNDMHWDHVMQEMVSDMDDLNSLWMACQGISFASLISLAIYSSILLLGAVDISC